jgi:hypothetical protein
MPCSGVELVDQTLWRMSSVWVMGAVTFFALQLRVLALAEIHIDSPRRPSMSMRSHFVPTHHVAHHAQRVEDVGTMTAAEVHSRLSATMMIFGGLSIVAGAWGGLAPFVGPTFGFSPDGAGSWHWDLARAMLSALPGAAAVVAGLLVIACARSAALAIGRGGVRLAGLVMFAAGSWFALGPSAWPVLWNNTYFIHSSSLSDFGRSAGFAAGPGLVLAATAGFLLGALLLRDRGRLVADDVEEVRPIDNAGTRNTALNNADGADGNDTAVDATPAERSTRSSEVVNDNVVNDNVADDTTRSITS